MLLRSKSRYIVTVVVKVEIQPYFDEFGKQYLIIANDGEHFACCVGEYRSEEVALEVLGEIERAMIEEKSLYVMPDYE